MTMRRIAMTVQFAAMTMILLLTIPSSVDASYCSDTEACHGIEICEDSGVCRCPWVGLAANGKISSAVSCPSRIIQ
jgi:hypothetical protein